ncbi:MAG: hypothetical protein K8I30_24010, partial [Anaerolineae bacterium]|nr:hypothetical protein [Anaerolineae bacterium]
LVDNSYNPYYVIRTEEGHTVYPGQWDAAQTAPETGHDDESPFFCSACHLTEFVPEILSIKANPPSNAARSGAPYGRLLDSNPTEYAIVEGRLM